MTGSWLALLALAVGGAPAPYEFKLEKAADAIAVRVEAKRTVFVVTSPSGIGGATVKLPKGDWPTHVAIRLEYGKGRGFQMLEGFRLRTDRIHIDGAGRDSKQMRFYFLDARGQLTKDETAVAGYLQVTVAERDGALEVTLPANLLAGSAQFSFHWIDAYRG